MNLNSLNDTSSRGLSVLVASQKRAARDGNSLPRTLGAIGVVNPLLKTTPGSVVPTVGQLSNDQFTALWQIASAASIGLSAYHGYRRNDSLGWGIIWGLLGGLFPIITPAIGLAQGFGKRA